MTSSASPPLSRGDRAALWLFSATGAAIGIAVAVAATLRIAQFLRGGAIDVAVELIDQRVPAPLGPGGEEVSVGLDRAILRTELPAASTAAGIIAQVVLTATFVTVILCLILLSRRLVAGSVFGRISTRLVTTAGMTGLIGAAAVQFFDNMVANGAVARVSDGDYAENAILSIAPFPFIVAAFAVALICSVFAIGDRLQRDTEGLV